MRIRGIGRFDRNNRLKAMEKVEHMTIVDPLDIRVRIDELKPHQAGWLDGTKGVPPAHEGLDWLADSFDSSYPNDVPLPYLFLTREGRVLAEWSLKRWSPSLEIDLLLKQGAWHVLNLETDEEQTLDLDLTSLDDWKWLADQIRILGGTAK